MREPPLPMNVRLFEIATVVEAGLITSAGGGLTVTVASTVRSAASVTRTTTEVAAQGAV